MKISVVIPNFNGADLLKKNLPKILHAVGDAQVIVVDDGSTDESLIVLKNDFPEINVIERKKNEGFASAVNDGFKKASHDLVLLLNSDVVPQDNFLKYLLPHFTDQKVFAVGCLQDNLSGKTITSQGRGIGKFKKGFLVHGPGTLDKKNTLWIFGGAGIFRKKIWEDLGGLDTIYNPFYWEDIDLSYRAQKLGFKLIFEPRSKIIHKQLEGAIRSSYSSSYIKVLAYRNQILFVWLNITDAKLIISHVIYLPIHLIRSIIAFDFAFLRGFLYAILKLPKVLINRIMIKRQYTLSDHEVLKNLSE